MSSQTITLLLIAVLVVLAAGLGIWLVIRRQHSEQLREKFGPEYDYTLEKTGDQRAAEAALEEREKRFQELNVHELEEAARERYQNEWLEVQSDFVDNPSKAVEDANRLVTEVMIARGFPVADFEQRAADLSVMYPDLVANYRQAYAIATQNQHNSASTEDLRRSMVYYHSMFAELLGTSNDKPYETREIVENEEEKVKEVVT